MEWRERERERVEGREGERKREISPRTLHTNQVMFTYPYGSMNKSALSDVYKATAQSYMYIAPSLAQGGWGAAARFNGLYMYMNQSQVQLLVGLAVNTQTHKPNACTLQDNKTTKERASKNYTYLFMLIPPPHTHTL